jgi:adenylate kinase family enzyme
MNHVVDRVVIIGNSGSGKSTLASRLTRVRALAHLDLDTLAWQPVTPPVRRPIADGAHEIDSFTHSNDRWVIEGCYADLISLVLPLCTLLIFLNPGVEACVQNARSRPWEPHKYPSKAAQDANLDMLIRWIHDYDSRADALSLAAHRRLYDGFERDKIELTSPEEVASWAIE